jgi:hypothetical protein
MECSQPLVDIVVKVRGFRANEERARVDFRLKARSALGHVVADAVQREGVERVVVLQVKCSPSSPLAQEGTERLGNCQVDNCDLAVT